MPRRCSVCKTPETPHRPFVNGVCPDFFCRQADKTARPDEGRCHAELEGLFDRYGIEFVARVFSNQLIMLATQLVSAKTKGAMLVLSRALREVTFDFDMQMRPGWQNRVLTRRTKKGRKK